ncbi:MAG: glycoside hydrolase family 5 protein [Kiritimatiellae bacterium]|nr:glycoside hydrolase family 5 protein [Kiritimatiellia bacterium]
MQRIDRQTAFAGCAIAAFAAFAAFAARAEVPGPCPARTISVADGQVQIAHHVDRKAAYHTLFACDDLAAGDWRAVAASRATSALDYDPCSNGIVRAPAAAGGASPARRFFRIGSSYAPFKKDDALPRAPVRDDLAVPLSKIDEREGSFDAATGRLVLPKPNKSSQIWFGSLGGQSWNNPVDATDYEWFVLEKHDATDSFNVRIYYNYVDPQGVTNVIQSSLGCETYRDRCYIRLDPRYKGSIRMIQIQAASNSWHYVPSDTAVTLDRIYFTQNRPVVPVVDEGPAVPLDDSIPATDFVRAMNVGWNLGGSLECHGPSWDPDLRIGLDTEVIWSSPYCTEEMIRWPKEHGYSTIRIPVTWYNHVIDTDYAIDPDWMRRVKQVVDWAIDAGYYVILNEHHSVRENMPRPLGYASGYIVRDDPNDIAESRRFLKAVWEQICAAFNDGYDEHLVFETMNEPRNTDETHGHVWQPGLACYYYNQELGYWRTWCDNRACPECLADYAILNDYNQLCLDTIRASGGNNARRFVMIPALCTGRDTIRADAGMTDAQSRLTGEAQSPGLFRMPRDSARDKLLATIHDYALGSSASSLEPAFTDAMKTDLSDGLRALHDHYTAASGIPIVIGEAGAQRKMIPLSVRLEWIRFLGDLARRYGMALVYWDSGGDREATMAEFDREGLRFYEPEFVQAMLGSMGGD